MAAAAFVSNALLLGRPSPLSTRALAARPAGVSRTFRAAATVRPETPLGAPALRRSHPGLAARALDLRGFHASVLTRAFDDAAPEPSPEPAAASPVDDADASPSTPPPPDDASAARDVDTVPTFAELGLPKSLCAALEGVGFSEPSLPQQASIPLLLEGRNVAMQSHTGSGKTMAYLLPVIARILADQDKPENERPTDVQCLVVVPSQELAMQIVRQMERVLGEFGKAITQQCIGGANVRRQEEAIRRKRPLVVVGTPGRLAELSRSGILRTHGVKCLVVDEADDLLASNFRRDMARIVDHTGKGVLGGRQTVIVSATLRPETLDQYVHIAPNLLHVIASRDASGAEPAAGANGAGADGDMAEPIATAALPPNLRHFSVAADGRHKVDRLRKAIHATGAERALVFLNFGHRLKDTRDKLATRGMSCGVLHGGMNKHERSAELAAFRRGDFRALLVSDLAARGIDVPEVDAVFNLELPTDQTHYVHRAGRTGRMGAEGFVLSIAEPKEKFVLNRIGRQLGVDIVAADLQNGELVPDRGDRPGVSRQQRDRDGEERREDETRPARGRGGGRGGGRGRKGGRGGAPQNYTPRGQPRRRTRKTSA